VTSNEFTQSVDEGGDYTARYNLDLQDLNARFDYNAFSDFNHRYRIEPALRTCTGAIVA
jgi:hypothetical protein